VTETAKQQQHHAAALLITATATPSDSFNNHDTKQPSAW